MLKKKKRKTIISKSKFLVQEFFQVDYFYVYAQHLIPAVVYQR